MNELIKVSEAVIGEQTVQTVDARSLYDFLEIKSEFRNWIKNRINDYGFTQGFDFIAGNFLPGSERIDYHITLSMAKELAMVERNDKGRQARQYFIECERQLQQTPLPQVTDPALAAIIQAVVQIDQVRQQQARLASEQQKLQADYEALAEQQRITDGKVEDFSTGAEHFSVTAYCKLFRGGYSISHQEANAVGKKLSTMAKNMGIKLGRAPHPLFGTVNTYPKALMDEFFSSLEGLPAH
jgi:anti-repressor protein